MIKVSLIASSVRPELYEDFFKSLEGTSVSYEVVFAGNNQANGYIHGRTNLQTGHYIGTNFKYIETEDIKPAQCYEIARRNAVGEVIIWVADDCEFPNDVIGKAYKYWKEQDNKKLVLSIQTKESGYGQPVGQLFDMNMHTFFGFNPKTPLMCPLAMIDRKYLEELGGFDKRYVAGQYENDVAMRVWADGGKVEVFGGKDCFIDIDHLEKSIRIGESKDEADFLHRPFATGYAKDREVLEKSWTPLKDFNRYDDFEPYDDTNILTKSQSNKGKWL